MLKKQINKFISLLLVIVMVTGFFTFIQENEAEAAKLSIRNGAVTYTSGKLVVKGKHTPGLVYAKCGASLWTVPNARLKPNARIKANEAVSRVMSIKSYSLVSYKGKWYFMNPKALKPAVYTARNLRKSGRLKWGGKSWTWYSQKQLPGKTLKIPGRHVSKEGFICDKNGYICIAARGIKKGTLIVTPFGRFGKVYDSGCPRGVMDIYTNF